VWQWPQLDHGIYKSFAPLSRQPCQHPITQVLYGPDALPTTQPTASKHSRKNVIPHVGPKIHCKNFEKLSLLPSLTVYFYFSLTVHFQFSYLQSVWWLKIWMFLYLCFLHNPKATLPLHCLANSFLFTHIFRIT